MCRKEFSNVWCLLVRHVPEMMLSEVRRGVHFLDTAKHLRSDSPKLGVPHAM